MMTPLQQGRLAFIYHALKENANLPETWLSCGKDIWQKLTYQIIVQ